MMCGLDVTMKAVIRREDRVEWKKTGKTGEFLHDAFVGYQKFYDQNNPEVGGVAVHDALPIAWLINSGILVSKECYVSVDLDGQHTRGSTTVDLRRYGPGAEKPNCIVGLDLDVEEFREMLLDATRKLG